MRFIGFDDNNNGINIGDKVSGVIEDSMGITFFENKEVRYHNFGYCVEVDGFKHFLWDSVELVKFDDIE